MVFEKLSIEEKILDAIKELGFENPTPVQAEVIPLLLNEQKQDIIALAQTGTGKTAAFGIPIIQKTNFLLNKIQYLILSPTRELCVQIADDLYLFAKYKPEIKIVPVFGGASIERQIQSVRRGVHIISATPGRLVDLINRGIIDFSQVDTVVLDEADEMLNMGFRDDLETILEQTLKTKTTLLFSATMPNDVRAIANKYMAEPIEITIGKKNAGAENVHHICYMVNPKDRYLALKRIVDFHPDIYGIIFCRTRKETQEVSDQLIKDGYNAEALHGDLNQNQRDLVMNKFRIKHLQLLVATDVAARGLDVENLTHIINYNLPEERDIYTHRSGRTGRAGRNGTSIVIANLKDKNRIQQIEKQINKKFTIANVPTGKEVCEKQLFHLIDRMEKVEVDSTEIEPYLPAIYRKLEWLERDELIKKFVSVEFNHFINYYKKMSDLNVPEESRRSSKRKGSMEGLTRFFINLGRLDDLKPKDMINMITDFTGIHDIEIGEIEILKSFSFFEADEKFKDLILKSFSHKDYKGRKISVEISQSKGKTKPKREDSFRKEKFKKEEKFGRERFDRDKRHRDDNNTRDDYSRKRRNRFGNDRPEENDFRRKKRFDKNSRQERDSFRKDNERHGQKKSDRNKYKRGGEERGRNEGYSKRKK